MGTPDTVLRRRGASWRLEPPLAPDQARQAADLLKVLADPTRLSMLLTLREAQQPVCVCDFVATYKLSQPTISHHMGKLKAAGLVGCHKKGIWVYYEVAGPLPPVAERLLEAVAISPSHIAGR